MTTSAPPKTPNNYSNRFGPPTTRSPISRPNSSIGKVTLAITLVVHFTTNGVIIFLTGDNISKKLEQKLDTRCIHTITQEDNNSVLSLAANDKYLFSGSQGSKIHVKKLLYSAANKHK
jgi:hypothetical protein